MVNITERQSGDTAILDLEGNLILGNGAQKIGQEIKRLIEAGKTRILLNFQAVKYIDSSGVGELISNTETVRKAGGSLMLSNLPSKVEQVISLSGVLPIFEIYNDESEALNGV